VRGCFVTGTDTGVGKTVLAAALVAALRARGVRVAAFKPVVTGIDEPEPGRPADHELLGAAAGMAPRAVAPLRFGPAVSPHLAAELAGTAIEPDGLVAAARAAGARADALVVEGVGGLLVPLTPEHTIRDVAVALGLPVVVAARPGLGTISHALLTVEAARAAGLEVRAVVLTPWPQDPSAMERSNRTTIARMGAVEVATLPAVGTAVDELAAAGAELPIDGWLGPEAAAAGAGVARAGVARAGVARAGGVGAGGVGAGGVGAGGGTARAGALPAPALRGERVVLRPPTEPDVARLAAILATPEVARWWPGENEETMRERVVEGEPDTASWAVWVGGEIVGLAQAWEETEPMYRHGGIDLFLHPDWHGRGLGSDTVRTVARWLFDERGHHRITIDPAADNAVAIRCYERVGFHPVGLMRRYERGPDGSWHDGLLMDMLTGELR
jgi:dethiobiotin synthetase